jgi:hypothetical protein
MLRLDVQPLAVQHVFSIPNALLRSVQFATLGIHPMPLPVIDLAARLEDNGVEYGCLSNSAPTSLAVILRALTKSFAGVSAGI